MKSILKTITSFLSLALCLATASCSDDKTTGIIVPDDVLYDFVTMVSTGDNGTVFQFRKNGDSSLITLTSQRQLDEKQVKPGQRVIIQYTPSGGQQAYQSGPIDLYGIVLITNGEAQIEPIATINAIHDSQYKMHTITRSGEYVDVWMEGQISKAPATFGIYVDETTADDAYPTAYLKYVSDRENINQTTSQIYGSFDISNVFSRSTCKGITIHYNNGLTTDYVRFDKDVNLPLQPTEPTE